MIDEDVLKTNEDEDSDDNINSNQPENGTEQSDTMSKKPNKRKQNFERKNIRNIIDDDQFCQDAKDAQKAEVERLKRVKEKEHNLRMFKLLSNDSINKGVSPALSTSVQTLKSLQQRNIFPKINASYLPPASALLNNGMQFKKSSQLINKMYRIVPDESVINLDVSDDDEDDFELRINQKFENKVEVIEISDGEEGDDDVDDVVDQDKLDIKNFNKDEYGRVLINVAHPEEEDEYFLCPKIGDNIKPHQVSGIRFLYNNLVESKKQFKECDGFGCILAHSMGLGKTIQVIGFLDILFRCVDARSALVIVPINTIQNWQAEMDHWLPCNKQDDSVNNNEENTNHNISSTANRPFSLFVIKECHKTIESRHTVIRDWLIHGGVMLLGYEMFRLLVTYRKSKTVGMKPKKKDSSDKIPKKKVCIDLELEEKRDGIYQDFLQALIDPGPEVIICDEGHRIKNSEASISKALKSVRTHRRVVMTGYPLQNNLTEYWCMVDFVRPNYLGSKHEFNNMFQRPIENGQCVDSTFEDRKLMQGRAHVLHELLQGFVQRRSHAVLKANLPPKWEYVLVVKLSPIQKRLYSTFMDQVINGGSNSAYNWAQNNILKTYAMCCKIWNHPDILYKLSKEKKDVVTEPDFDFDIEDEYSTSTTSKQTNRSSSVTKRNNRAGLIMKDSPSPSTNDSQIIPLLGMDDDSSNGTTSVSMLNKSLTNASGASQHPPPSKYMSYQEYLENVQHNSNTNSSQIADSFAWVTDDLWQQSSDNCADYMTECQDNGGKIVIFLSLLQECLKYGDKMLLFSQSLLTLDLIELFLRQSKLPNGAEWMKNKTYFRLDGSTSAMERERMITSFNAPESEAGLFLLSTRAGCLGINLIGANRVIVFDASWNPCHDCQAVCRVYRYGQIKPCFIYRLITDNTMEKKIYDRQVKKQGISDRVVDESNPGQQFTRSQVQILIDYNNPDQPTDTDVDDNLQTDLSQLDLQSIREGCGEEDPVLGRIIEQHSNWITKIPFTHESLLIDQKHYRLTKREKRKAKERYEIDKRQSLYYQRNNYSDYFVVKTTDALQSVSGLPLPKTSRTSSILPLTTPTITGSIGSVPIITTTVMSNTTNNNSSSNIISSLSLNQFSPTSDKPSLPSQTNSQFKLNRNFSRPSRPLRPTGALMREIEQARLRCGFTNVVSPNNVIGTITTTTSASNTKTTNGIASTPSTVANRENLDPPILSKSIKDEEYNGLSFSKSKLSQPIIPNNDIKSTPLISTSTVSSTPSSADNKYENKNIKIIKINATTEMLFPAINNTVTTSQAGSDMSQTKTKINVGEPLEIIYTPKGKFLRVSRTGDLFAIKDSSTNKDADKSQKLNTTEIVKNSINTARESSLNVKSEDTKSISNSIESSITKEEIKSVIDRSPVVFTQSQSEPQMASTINSISSSVMYSQPSPNQMVIPPSACCQCKLTQFNPTCLCNCHKTPLPSNHAFFYPQTPFTYSSPHSHALHPQLQMYNNPYQSQPHPIPHSQPQSHFFLPNGTTTHHDNYQSFPNAYYSYPPSTQLQSPSQQQQQPWYTHQPNATSPLFTPTNFSPHQIVNNNNIPTSVATQNPTANPIPSSIKPPSSQMFSNSGYDFLDL